MVYFLTIFSALCSVIGNLSAKYWSDTRRLPWILLTFTMYNLGTMTYLWSLRYGKFTIVTSLFYTLVPMVTIFSGVFLFRDKVTQYQLLGIVLSVLGILLFTFEGKIAN
jgi:drug/metabolite transporter (DMT)-like permease